MTSHKNFSKGNQQKKKDLFKQRRVLNKDCGNMTKSERLMSGVGLWTSYYRLFPHLFVKDFFGIQLKVFQQILIYFMMHYNYFMYIASRGQGKSFLTAIFACTRAILFPESKIILAAGTKSQSIEIIEKISELRSNSPNLAREIDELKTGTNDARVTFKNGSWIRAVASNQGSRSKRANIIVCDEFRMIPKDIIDSVLRKFMTAPRQPGYLNKAEYKHLQERNKELYLSSAWFKHDWSWEKVNAFFKSMLDGKSYFLCSLPYQLPIKEGLLMREQVEDEMSEADFSEISWLMEMEAKFFGESEKAFFKFAELDKNRGLTNAIYPKYFYDILKDKNFRYETKPKDAIRLVTCDISGMSSEKNNNDASVYTVIELRPSANKKSYNMFVIYIESSDGGHSLTQAIEIRRLYDNFDCDYIVIDTQSFGLGVYDNLVTDLYDKELGKQYDALNCINDETMAKRCFVQDAPKVIWSIKATPQLNSDMHMFVRDTLQQGKINLLINENECKDTLMKFKGYSDLSVEDQTKMIKPYLQTSLLIQEMVNLERVDTGNTMIKLKEPSTKRKDRYSSLGYGVYVAKQLERKLKKVDINFDDDDEYVMWI